jgi:hypothetical protein
LLPLAHVPVVIDLDEVASTTTGDEMYVCRKTLRKVQSVFGKGRKLSLMVQSRPKNGTSSTSTGGIGGGAAEEGNEVMTKGNGNSAAATAMTTTTEEWVEVRVRESLSVGEGQVWVGEKVREELGLLSVEGDGAYELLK